MLQTGFSIVAWQQWEQKRSRAPNSRSAVRGFLSLKRAPPVERNVSPRRLSSSCGKSRELIRQSGLSHGLLNPVFVWNVMILNDGRRNLFDRLSTRPGCSRRQPHERVVAVEAVAFVCGDWRHVIPSPRMSGNNEVRAGPMSRVIISSDKPPPTATSGRSSG